MTAMVCFAALTAEYVAGKAARDALYLAHLDVTTLPAMVIATSAVSIALVAANAKVAARIAPSTLVPALFAVSAALLVRRRSLLVVATTTLMLLQLTLGMLFVNRLWAA